MTTRRGIRLAVATGALQPWQFFALCGCEWECVTEVTFGTKFPCMTWFPCHTHQQAMTLHPAHRRRQEAW